MADTPQETICYLQQIWMEPFWAALTNTVINALILRLLGCPWRRSLYAASLLAQIGEFSFVLALVGYQAEIIGQFAYQVTLSVISVTLLLSPAWIAVFRRFNRGATPGLSPTT